MICSKRCSQFRRWEGSGGEEDHPDPILGEGREANADLGTCLLEKGMRGLQKDACPIARGGFSAAGTSMGQVLEHDERLAHDLVRLDALDVHDKSDAARVVLESGIV